MKNIFHNACSFVSSREGKTMMKTLRSIGIMVLFLPFMSAGCSSDAPEHVNFPEYPSAQEDQTLYAQFLGKSRGNIRRIVTGDPYDEVFTFYREGLKSYNPKISSYALEDGRQAAFAILETKKSSQTVVIQEFKQEGLVAITFMTLQL